MAAHQDQPTLAQDLSCESDNGVVAPWLIRLLGKALDDIRDLDVNLQSGARSTHACHIDAQMSHLLYGANLVLASRYPW